MDAGTVYIIAGIFTLVLIIGLAYDFGRGKSLRIEQDRQSELEASKRLAALNRETCVSVISEERARRILESMDEIGVTGCTKVANLLNITVEDFNALRGRLTGIPSGQYAILKSIDRLESAVESVRRELRT
jgi:hypothetical protein